MVNSDELVLALAVARQYHKQANEWQRQADGISRDRALLRSIRPVGALCSHVLVHARHVFRHRRTVRRVRLMHVLHDNAIERIAVLEAPPVAELKSLHLRVVPRLARRNHRTAATRIQGGIVCWRVGLLEGRVVQQAASFLPQRLEAEPRFTRLDLVNVVCTSLLDAKEPKPFLVDEAVRLRLRVDCRVATLRLLQCEDIRA